MESILEATGASLTQHHKELLDYIIESLEIPEDETFGIDPGLTPELRDFHFDFGNSSYGPVGGCAVVAHFSAEGALELLRERMLEEVDILDSFSAGGEPHVIYGKVYLNESAITLRDIDEVTEHKKP